MHAVMERPYTPKRRISEQMEWRKRKPPRDAPLPRRRNNGENEEQVFETHQHDSEPMRAVEFGRMLETSHPTPVVIDTTRMPLCQ
jgi:hypothetical protein